MGCFSKASTVIHSENWSPASAKSDEPPSFAPRSYYPFLLHLINNTFTFCVFSPTKPFCFSERFVANECKLAVEGPEQEILFAIREGVPDVKLFFIMNPRPIPVPEETQVTHLTLKPPCVDKNQNENNIRFSAIFHANRSACSVCTVG